MTGKRYRQVRAPSLVMAAHIDAQCAARGEPVEGGLALSERSCRFGRQMAACVWPLPMSV